MKEQPPYSTEIYKVDSMEGYKFKVLNEKGGLVERRYAPYEMILTNVDERRIEDASKSTVSTRKKNKKRAQALASASKEDIARDLRQAKRMVTNACKVDMKLAVKNRMIVKGPVKRKPYF